MRHLPAILLFALFAALPAAASSAATTSAMLDRAAKAHAAGPADPRAPASNRHQPRAAIALEPVPEPAIWSMMIAGIGFAGAALRRKAKRPRPLLGE